MVDLLQVLTTTEVPMDELPDGLAIDELSDGDYDLDDLFGIAPETARVADGPVVLAGPVCLDRPDEGLWIVVRGDLEVDGLLCLSAWDQASIVVVTGALVADTVVVDAEIHLYVLGDARIRTLYANLGDAGMARFAAGLTCARFVHAGRGDVLRETDEPEATEEVPADLQDLAGRLNRALSLLGD